MSFQLHYYTNFAIKTISIELRPMMYHHLFIHELSHSFRIALMFVPSQFITMIIISMGRAQLKIIPVLGIQKPTVSSFTSPFTLIRPVVTFMILINYAARREPVPSLFCWLIWHLRRCYGHSVPFIIVHHRLSPEFRFCIYFYDPPSITTPAATRLAVEPLQLLY